MNDVASEGYRAFLQQIKEKIATSQLRASLAVNHELIGLYWQIGTSLLAKQEKEGWGELRPLRS